MRTVGLSRNISFLCVLASLREHNPFWQRISRKDAKAAKFQNGLQSPPKPLTRKIYFFDLYSGAPKPFGAPSHRFTYGKATSKWGHTGLSSRKSGPSPPVMDD